MDFTDCDQFEIGFDDLRGKYIHFHQGRTGSFDHRFFSTKLVKLNTRIQGNVQKIMQFPELEKISPQIVFFLLNYLPV